MHPVLLEIGSFKIYSYGFFIAVGYVSALLLGRFLAKSKNRDPSPFMDIAFIAIVSGVIGSRVLYVMTEPSKFIANPLEIFDVWNGGLVFYGGLLLAGATSLAYGAWKKIPLVEGADIVLTGVAFAHAFGRIGCLAAGCCHGSACRYPWGILNNTPFVDPALRGQPLHPVQLYESISLFALSGMMTWLIYKSRARNGISTAVYLLGYSSIRFFLENFRGDSERGFVLDGALSTSQVISIVLFMLGLLILPFAFRRKDL